MQQAGVLAPALSSPRGVCGRLSSVQNGSRVVRFFLHASAVHVYPERTNARNSPPILIDFAHRCSFCGQGQYQFQNGPEDEYRNVAGAQALGITAPRYRSPAQFSNNFFMMAICDKYSHVQVFRPDLVKGARELWLRKRE